MGQGGWIKLHRKITDCELWQTAEPYTRRDAWVDLLMMAAYDDKQVAVGNAVITIHPGDILTSQEQLGKRWGWTRKRVRGYLDLLASLDMAVVRASSKFTVIRITKYHMYQVLDRDSEVATTGFICDTKGPTKGTAKGPMRVQEKGQQRARSESPKNAMVDTVPDVGKNKKGQQRANKGPDEGTQKGQQRYHIQEIKKEEERNISSSVVSILTPSIVNSGLEKFQQYFPGWGDAYAGELDRLLTEVGEDNFGEACRRAGGANNPVAYVMKVARALAAGNDFHKKLTVQEAIDELERYNRNAERGEGNRDPFWDIRAE